MNQIEKNVLAKVTNVLQSLGLKYAIVDSDGNKHGDLNVAQEKKLKRRRSIFPLGELRNHIMPHLQSILINTTKHVPCGKYPVESVRSSISSYATQLWGAGTYKTHISADKKFVEVTRFDKQVAEFMNSDPLGDLFEGLEIPRENEYQRRMRTLHRTSS